MCTCKRQESKLFTRKKYEKKIFSQMVKYTSFKAPKYVSQSHKIFPVQISQDHAFQPVQKII